jgi:hypothetical protein
MSDPITSFIELVNSPEQPQAAPSTGTEEKSATAAPAAPSAPQGQVDTQSKQDRHAATKIQQLSESRLEVGRLAVENNPDSLISIYEKDKELAEKLFEEYDFKADSLEEFIHAKTNPKQDFAEVKRFKELESKSIKVETELLDMKVDNLRQTNPDLSGEVEVEFRRLLTSNVFPEKSMTEILAIARLAAGKPVDAMSGETIKDVRDARYAATAVPNSAPAKGSTVDKSFLQSLGFSAQDIEIAAKL